jgi:hypothetical protein
MLERTGFGKISDSQPVPLPESDVVLPDKKATRPRHLNNSNEPKLDARDFPVRVQPVDCSGFCVIRILAKFFIVYSD